jgi:hypothetical protein
MANEIDEEEVPEEIKAIRAERCKKLVKLHKIQSEIDQLHIKELKCLKGLWVAAPCPSSTNLTSVVRVVDVTEPRKCRSNGRIKMQAEICLRLDFSKKHGVFVYPKSKKFELIAGSYHVMSVVKLMGLVEKNKFENPRLEPEFEKAMAQF